jgi:hypothetical protein
MTFLKSMLTFNLPPKNEEKCFHCGGTGLYKSNQKISGGTYIFCGVVIFALVASLTNLVFTPDKPPLIHPLYFFVPSLILGILILIEHKQQTRVR